MELSYGWMEEMLRQNGVRPISFGVRLQQVAAICHG